MMSAYYEFFCPVKIVAGHAALENIPFELKILGAKRPLIISDQGVKQNGLLNPIQQVFDGTEVEIAGIFDHVPADSSVDVVSEVAKYYRHQQCDAILAVGGGSVIDTAKAVNILVSEGGDDVLQYVGAHHLTRPLKPLFVIPTTAGTGSEVTMVAVISHPQKQQKVSFASYYLMPNVAILDPRMTLTLPAKITAMTAMDALTHAIEAYTGLAHNAMSDAYATAAIEKISQSLFVVLEQPDHKDARLELAQASTMAGIAFSNSMVALVHSLGHALGAVAHLPHGLCMNLFLPYVLRYNLEHDRERLAKLLLPLAGADVFAATPAQQRAEKVIDTILKMRDQLHQLTQLPRTLQETGQVSPEQFDEIAEKALNDGSIIFNHREASFEQLKQILHDAWQ
ncbi:MAG: iron-containing alcohol dehydrogenase [Acinetobacter sp.]|nr:iron-containing alcohol dehydrogenase [Acinetobacter sp.]